MKQTEILHAMSSDAISDTVVRQRSWSPSVSRTKKNSFGLDESVGNFKTFLLIRTVNLSIVDIKSNYYFTPFIGTLCTEYQELLTSFYF